MQFRIAENDVAGGLSRAQCNNVTLIIVIRQIEICLMVKKNTHTHTHKCQVAFEIIGCIP